MPYQFRDLCKKKYGLDVETDFYERGFGHGIMSRPTFFHQVDVFRGFMVIDWTARQYREFDKEPYPFVYKVGDERIPKFWGELIQTVKWKREKEEKKNK